jgi:acetyl-CoA carboxylase biotin carboxylase subunit
MGEAAVKITRAVNYTGAGTVEFLVEDATRDFYFLEMNTRLQVEHPVTELVTGFDLVREQFSVAAGGELSFKQEDVRLQGHAIECRIYAEDPENNFFPSPGTITHLQEPSGPGIRIDSGVRLNSEVSIHYDSMISKLAVWGRSRSEAIDRLRRALDEYEVSGITTTLPFFRQIVRDEEFIAGRLDTGFIVNFNARRDSTQQTKEGVPTQAARVGCEVAIVDSDMALVAAALHYIKNQRRASVQVAAQSSDRWKLSGRAALLNTNQAISRRTKASSNRNK